MREFKQISEGTVKDGDLLYKLPFLESEPPTIDTELVPTQLVGGSIKELEEIGYEVFRELKGKKYEQTQSKNERKRAKGIERFFLRS